MPRVDANSFDENVFNNTDLFSYAAKSLQKPDSERVKLNA